MGADKEKYVHGGGPLLSSTSKARTSGTNPTIFVLLWIGISSFVILHNKSILYNSRFLVLTSALISLAIFLTTVHLIFAALATQILARTTNIYPPRALDISQKVYFQRIVPVALCYSLSLVCSNQAYMYLNISFIQMLKATSPVAVFIVSSVLHQESFRIDVLANLWIIVLGVFIASFGEIKFSIFGVGIELTGILFEALRLVMMNRLLHAPDGGEESDATVYNSKKGQGKPMSPLVCLYYFAPICAVFNVILFLLSNERQHLTFSALEQLGASKLLLNAFGAFLLNVSVVFLIGRTSSLVLTLCGILKDIILVLVSSLMWRTTISRIQVVGYLVALTGLFGYKLGYSPVLALLQAADRQGYKKYYLSLSRRARRRVATACLVMSLTAAAVFYYSQTLQISGGVTDGEFTQLPNEQFEPVLDSGYIGGAESKR